MRNLFKFKLEVFVVIMNTIACILSYSMYLDGNKDWRLKVLLYFCGFILLISIFGFKTIREFRREVLRRW